MLRFVVALPFEARPLIARYRLERFGEASAFQVFRRDEVALVVSGPGKVAAAAATSFLHLTTGGERDAAWLNVGIAGHGSLPVGEALVAHKIRDRASGQCWYPPRLIASRCATDQVTTVDRVEKDFDEPGAYEMEASGFYPTACRFATAELVQCLKIVSDGPAAPAENLSAKVIEQLIAGRLAAVDRLAEECRRLSGEVRQLVQDPPDFQHCLAGWRFTVSEQRELRRLLRRRQTLVPDRPLPLDDIGLESRGREVNRQLRSWLDSLAVAIEPLPACDRDRAIDTSAPETDTSAPETDTSAPKTDKSWTCTS